MIYELELVTISLCLSCQTSLLHTLIVQSHIFQPSIIPTAELLYLLACVAKVHRVDGAAWFPPADQVFASGALAWIETFRAR